MTEGRLVIIISSIIIIFFFTFPAQASRWSTTANTNHAALEHTQATVCLHIAKGSGCLNVFRKVACHL
jgi:hypothetical protein